MIASLYPILGFLIAIGILVVVHELGHYGVARWLNVKILRFSIGFGPVLARFRTGKDQTEWAISAIPLGGYVKMLDKELSTPEDSHRAFDSLPPLKRMAIAIAGPMANFVFAIVIGWLMGMIGTQELLPRIAQPEAHSPAYEAGLREGDLITDIDGRTIYSWQDLSMSLLVGILGQKELAVTAQQPTQPERHLTLDFQQYAYQADDADLLKKAGFGLQRPTLPPVVQTVIEGSPAAMAGIQPDDRIVSVDHQPIEDWIAFVQAVQQKPGQAVSMEIMRGDALHVLILTPNSKTINGKTIGQIGVSADLESPMKQLVGTVQLGPGDAFVYGLHQVADNVNITLRFFVTMITGKMSSSHLSGPIAIADYAGQSVQMGWDSFFKFLALISVGLGIINLFPIPMLDGGHLLYYAIELVRGRPLSLRTQAIGQAMGLAIVVSLTLLVLYNDINRYFVGSVE